VSGKATVDDNRRRYVPGDKLTRRDRLWPRRHGRHWNWDKGKGRTKTVEELYFGLRVESANQARETLEHVADIAQTAVDRAAAADRRATTIAGTVAIAASLTVGGAGLVLDTDKVPDAWARVLLAAILLATTFAFGLSALYALRALVATRTWNWSKPTDLPLDEYESRPKQLGMRAAHLLEDFAGNWEISDQKNRTVDLSLRMLVAGLVGLVLFGAAILGQVLARL
jgi:hypothetical protein